MAEQLFQVGARVVADGEPATVVEVTGDGRLYWLSFDRDPRYRSGYPARYLVPYSVPAAARPVSVGALKHPENGGGRG